MKVAGQTMRVWEKNHPTVHRKKKVDVPMNGTRIKMNSWTKMEIITKSLQNIGVSRIKYLDMHFKTKFQE